MQKRLLIVDDHEVVREGLASALAADERFEIVGTAATGKEALQRARQTLPDIALVDLRLPDMRGEDLTRELRNRFPSTAVIILTTYLGEGTVRSALEAGASAYVTKAAGLPELRAAIERVMRGRHRGQRHRRPRRSSSSCTRWSPRGWTTRSRRRARKRCSNSPPRG